MSGKRLCLAFASAMVLAGCATQQQTMTMPMPMQSAGLSSAAYDEALHQLLTLVDTQNPRAALDVLRQKSATDSAFASSCHPLAHAVGREAFKKYKSFSTAMQYQDEVCNSGYEHGVIESDFLEATNITAKMQSVCAGTGSGGYQAWECFHGVGHGVMYYTANDLPKALGLCDTYTSTFARQSCMNGAFMENFNSDLAMHPTQYVKASDPFYPCPEEPDADKTACYDYAPTYYLTLHPQQYQQALAWCTNAESAHQADCIEGVGGQAMKDHILEPQLVESVCASGASWETTACIAGMADLLVNHYASPDKSQTVCDTLQTAHKKICTEVVTAERVMFH